ncbi:MAG: saccharopine dehydrogenase-like NADP-dependent oxidoreductase [Lentimonas sp.]|jgi:saccharopine dehydrogenase-like NADP-dependent oxidoreductase
MCLDLYLCNKLHLNMKKVSIFGAGLSSSSLIKYLLSHAEQMDIEVTVLDFNADLINKKIKGFPHAKSAVIDALNPIERLPFIRDAHLVISMLPARFHMEIVKDCLTYKKNIITPSYISDELRAMDAQAKEAGIIIMNEMGVDPGLDHMSAMKIIDGIHEKGGKIHSFKSFCGGLVAPAYDNNPWKYKFTWNPRNVVLAGQGGASCFIEEGQYKYIPYNRLFTRLDTINVDGFGKFEGYPNRDSLKYRSIYGLEEIPTIYRGTLRRPGYAQAWNTMIELGLTDDDYKMDKSETLSARTFLNAFLPYHPTTPVESKLKDFLGEERQDQYEKFEWLGMFDNDNVMKVKDASPAQLLQEILVRKLSLAEGDKDMLVMYHEFVYFIGQERKTIVSQMVNLGHDSTYTSMSNTVGLPVAICAKMILNGEIQLKGVQMPLAKEVYTPILKELEDLGISFKETER